jgi:antitoxin VapB
MSRKTNAAAAAPKEQAIARVFWSGRSQAVRLPKAFRLTGSIVRIHAEGDRLVLSPDVERDRMGWPLSFREVFGAVDEDFDLGDRGRPAERRNPLAR